MRVTTVHRMRTGGLTDVGKQIGTLLPAARCASMRAKYFSHEKPKLHLCGEWNNRPCSDVLGAHMPILRKESDIFPEDLFELSVADAPWEIAHVRSRQEKSVARLLHDCGKPFYLPQIKQTTKRFERTFVSYLPLFPGYVFLRRVEGLRQTLWRTSAIANMIGVPDHEQ